MNVWVARLKLFYNYKTDKYETEFHFKKEKESSFVFDEDLKEWVFVEYYIIKRIPKNMKLTEDNYIIQGFDRELDEKELKEVEINMIKMLEEELRKEFSSISKDYMNKLEGLALLINKEK